MDKQKEREKLILEMTSLLPRFRQELGLSQTDFGEKVGVSRQTISSIERGTQELSWSNYLSILMFLNIHNGNDFIEGYIKENYDDIKEILDSQAIKK